MTILQALKKIKHLDRKIEKNMKRIQRWCSYFDDEQPLYDGGGIKRLIQSSNDMIDESTNLRHQIHATNTATKMEFDNKEMTLDELIALKTSTIPKRLQVLSVLRRKEKQYHHDKDVKVVLQYDPSARDKVVDALENMSDEVDALLDHMNISTELV